MNKKIAAVIVAAGSGTRMGASINKVFLPLGKYTVIDYTVNTVLKSEKIDMAVLVTREEDIDEAEKHIKHMGKPIKVISGGKIRQESVFKGLREITGFDIAVIHDGARALITTDIINCCIEDCIKYGAAAAGVLCKDTLKQIDKDGFIQRTVDRSITYQIQTPQVFYLKDILLAHERAVSENISVTDDCALYEKYIGKVRITQGSYSNIKLTTPEDMITAEGILRKRELL